MLNDLTSKIRFGGSMLKLALKTIRLRHLIKEGDEDKVYIYATKIGKVHAKEALKILGAKLHVTGRENIPDVPVLYMGNHQSYFDPYIMLSLREDRRETYIAKIEMRKYPVMGEVSEAFGALFLDRNNPREGLKTILEAIDRISSKGHDVLIYPEGTRSKGPDLGEFHKGSFKISQKTGCPIVPVVIDNSYRMYDDTKKIRKGQDVYLSFLPPIYPEKLTKEEQKNIDEIVKSTIQAELDRLRSTYSY